MKKFDQVIKEMMGEDPEIEEALLNLIQLQLVEQYPPQIQNQLNDSLRLSKVEKKGHIIIYWLQSYYFDPDKNSTTYKKRIDKNFSITVKAV